MPYPDDYSNLRFASLVLDPEYQAQKEKEMKQQKLMQMILTGLGTAASAYSPHADRAVRTGMLLAGSIGELQQGWQQRKDQKLFMAEAAKEAQARQDLARTRGRSSQVLGQPPAVGNPIPAGMSAGTGPMYGGAAGKNSPSFSSILQKDGAIAAYERQIASNEENWKSFRGEPDYLATTHGTGASLPTGMFTDSQQDPEQEKALEFARQVTSGASSYNQGADTAEAWDTLVFLMGMGVDPNVAGQMMGQIQATKFADESEAGLDKMKYFADTANKERIGQTDRYTADRTVDVSENYLAGDKETAGATKFASEQARIGNEADAAATKAYASAVLAQGGEDGTARGKPGTLSGVGKTVIADLDAIIDVNNERVNEIPVDDISDVIRSAEEYMNTIATAGEKLALKGKIALIRKKFNLPEQGSTISAHTPVTKKPTTLKEAIAALPG